MYFLLEAIPASDAEKAPRRSSGLVERLTGWKAEIPSARGNVFPPGSDSRRGLRRTPHRSVRGSGRAADGNRTRVSGLGSVRSTIELQPHPLQSSVYRAGS